MGRGGVPEESTFGVSLKGADVTGEGEGQGIPYEHSQRREGAEMRFAMAGARVHGRLGGWRVRWVMEDRLEK